MKVIINIPDEDYKDIKRYGVGKGAFKVLDAIKNGIVLPKGHGELKDADAMINKLCTQEASELFGSTTCAEILDFINDEKSIIGADREV